MDCEGHGTDVAGVAAGPTGVAPDAKIVADQGFLLQEHQQRAVLRRSAGLRHSRRESITPSPIARRVRHLGDQPEPGRRLPGRHGSRILRLGRARLRRCDRLRDGGRNPRRGRGRQRRDLQRAGGAGLHLVGRLRGGGLLRQPRQRVVVRRKRRRSVRRQPGRAGPDRLFLRLQYQSVAAGSGSFLARVRQRRRPRRLPRNLRCLPCRGGRRGARASGPARSDTGRASRAPCGRRASRSPTPATASSRPASIPSPRSRSSPGSFSVWPGVSANIPDGTSSVTASTTVSGFTGSVAGVEALGRDRSPESDGAAPHADRSGRDGGDSAGSHGPAAASHQRDLREDRRHGAVSGGLSRAARETASGR